MEITLAQLAVQLNGTLMGNNADALVEGIAGLDTVDKGQVTYIITDKNLPEAEATSALAIIAPLSLARARKPLILVENPSAAFSRALSLFDWRRPPIPGIDPQASIAKSAAIHAHAHIGAFSAIGEGAVIGEGCVIYPHVVIGDHVEIGTGTIIHPNATVYARCRIGRKVIIHAGAVIGADGHGFIS